MDDMDIAEDVAAPKAGADRSGVPVKKAAAVEPGEYVKRVIKGG